MTETKKDPDQPIPPEIRPPAGIAGRLLHLPRRLLSGGGPFKLKETTLLLLVAAFMLVVHNTAFFAKVFEIYQPGGRYLLFHVAVAAVVFGLTVFVLALTGSKYTTKPVAMALLVSSSIVSYFVNTYGVVVDDDMLRNTMQTNTAEVADLLNLTLVLYVVLLGVLPCVIVWRLRVDYGSFWKNILRRTVLMLCSIVLIAAALFSSPRTFASFLREHKPVRAYVNPLGYVYAAGKITAMHFKSGDRTIHPFARDARRSTDGSRHRLVVFVVGETARADRFSLNGYARETNPLLKQEDIVNFSNVMAAGTSTAISVPAMFSHLTREEFNVRKARYTENVLDILARVGVSVLWRDNNSDSKDVAVRVTYEDFKTPERNPVFDDEARDEGMLVDLQDYIDSQKGDVLVVLHSMGNHGPAYYKRYPKAFERFTPVCESNQLETCTTEEINNAYDNAILYTDYFLSKVIALLKNNDSRFETAMLYFSDHGESLGENNMYLHGYPYAFAPMEQKHVPAVFWFGRGFPVDRARMRAQSGAPYSHDNIFHTLLGLFHVETSAYEPALDMVSPFVAKPAARP